MISTLVGSSADWFNRIQFINQDLDRIHSARSCFPLCPSDVTLWFWRKVLDDPALMQIKLSISASHRAAILKASGASALVVRKPTQDTLRLRLGMIKSIQEIFRTESKIYTESTIFAISHLLVSEVGVSIPISEGTSFTNVEPSRASMVIQKPRRRI